MEFEQNRFITITIKFESGNICTSRDVFAFYPHCIEYTDKCYQRCNSKYCSYRLSTLIEYKGKTYPLTYTTMITHFQEWIDEKYGIEDYIELDDLVL